MSEGYNYTPRHLAEGSESGWLIMPFRINQEGQNDRHLSARVSFTLLVLSLDLVGSAPVALAMDWKNNSEKREVCLWYYEVRQKGRVDLMGVKGSWRCLPLGSWCWPGVWRVARSRVELMFSLDGARGSLNRPFLSFCWCVFASY